MEKVSIIINTYKRDISILDQAVKSAVNQTYCNKEIVVVDDNSDDVLSQSIKDCIGKYNGLVLYAGYEGNKGACFARNFGAQLTNGKYLAFLDDDDIWHTDKIEKQVAYLEKQKCLLVGCNSYHVTVDSNWNEQSRVLDARTTSSEITMEQLLNKNVVGGCSFPLMLRSAFEEVGGFTVGLPSAQDYDLWIRIKMIGKVGHIQEALLDYYIHKAGSITGNVKNKIFSYNHIIEKYGYLAQDINTFESNKYLRLSWVCFIGCDFKNGWKYWSLGLSKKISIANISVAFKALVSCVKSIVKLIIRRQIGIKKTK